MGPIIFLHLAERQNGKVDALFASGSGQSVQNFNWWNDNRLYLNYTEVETKLLEANLEANLSPRMQYCRNTKITFDKISKEDCIGFFDIEQEKAIGLAVGWDFEPLAPGECLVPAAYANDGVLIGSDIQANIRMGDLLQVLADQYNA